MVAIKRPAFQDALKRWPADIWAVLIYGSDDGWVKEHAKTLVETLCLPNDPFNPVRLLEEDVAQRPSLLRETLYEVSMLGGRRVVCLKITGEKSLKACQHVLEEKECPGFLVVESDSLPKASKLRALFERAVCAYALPLYEQTGEEIRHFVRASLAEEGLSLTDDGLSFFVSLLSARRFVIRMEVEKLILYAQDRTLLTQADVAEVCGESSELAMDTLLDCTFLGDWSSVGGYLMHAQQNDLLGNRLCAAVASHLALLKGLKHKVQIGQSPDFVVKSAQPPIFFQRQRAVARTVALWSMESLKDLEGRILESVADMRLYPVLEVALSERLLLAIAQKARGLLT